MRERIVVAYAGSLQTSMAICSLAKTGGAEVMTHPGPWAGRDLEEIRDPSEAAELDHVPVPST